MSGPLTVLALTRKPHSASFEQRVLNYIAPLASLGVQVQWKPLPERRREHKAILAQLPDYDVVWWHRYLISPLSAPPWRQAARKIFFDYDDPIIYSTHGSARWPNLSRYWKFSRFLRRCDGALAASESLAAFARRQGTPAFVVPMAVDIPQPLPPRDTRNGVELLWLGGRSTQRFLPPILPALEQLARQRPQVRLRLVAHEPMETTDLKVDFRRWSPAEQQAALREGHVGLCPMPDNQWTRGKCPYKVLQYMAYGMAWVGSAVGENLTTAGAGEDARGLCATQADQWCTALLSLVDAPDAAVAMGRRGRAYVQAHHSRAALAQMLADIFRGPPG